MDTRPDTRTDTRTDTRAALWSPDLDAYAGGRLDADLVRCALCQAAPCACPEFGTAEYFALVKARHNLP